MPTIRGNSSDETLNGTNQNDKLLGRGGDDILNGGDGDDLLKGGGGKDTLNGGNGADTLKGGGGRDTLDGGAGDDILDGGRGADTLVWSGGNDVFTGGAGADVFEFGLLSAGRNYVRITDFEDGVDMLDFSAYSLDTKDHDISYWDSGTGVMFYMVDTATGLPASPVVHLEGMAFDNFTPDDFIL
ncbi:MAG: hypothetical protein AAFQ22_00720 [Pseudomonadota bacterium]